MNNIHELQKEMRTRLGDVGVKEAEKHAALHRLAEINKGQEEFKKEVEDQFASININLEDGTYEVIKEDE